MLQITVPATELWDERVEKFIYTQEQTLRLEHSLVSLSKWESKWCKPFLSTKNLTDEETLDYIKCMTLDQNVDSNVYTALTDENVEQIREYINAPMSATTFSEDSNGKKNREIITSELIYYWMVSFRVPSDYENWHLNRLITLLRICGIKNQPPKKQNRQDVMRRNAALNAARRKQLNSRG